MKLSLHILELTICQGPHLNIMEMFCTEVLKKYYYSPNRDWHIHANTVCSSNSLKYCYKGWLVIWKENIFLYGSYSGNENCYDIPLFRDIFLWNTKAELFQYVHNTLLRNANWIRQVQESRSGLYCMTGALYYKH